MRRVLLDRRARWVLIGVMIAFAVTRSWIITRTTYLEDFEAYRRGAWGFVHGGDPYALKIPIGQLSVPFNYPPFAAILFVPAILVSQATATFAHSLLNYVLTFAVAFLFVDELSIHGLGEASGPPTSHSRYVLWCSAALALVGLGTEPFIATIGLGQINLVIVALIAFDLLRLRGRKINGLLIGLAAGMKLTPLIFVLYLALTRRFRAAATALVAMATTIAIGWMVMANPSTTYFFPRQTRPDLLEQTLAANQSMNGVISFVMRERPAARTTWIVVAAVTLLIGCVTARRLYDRFGELAGLAIIAVTGLLISPTSWTHHWVWWILPGVILIQRAWTSRSPLSMLAAVMWAAPFVLGEIWFVPYPPAPAYGAAVVHLIIDRMYVIAGVILLLGGAVIAVRRPDASPEASRVADAESASVRVRDP